MVVYVCYQSTFDLEVAMKHYRRVKFIVEKYRMHKIIVVGDFNLHDIVWTADYDDDNGYLPHTLTNATANGSLSNYQTDALYFLDKMLSLSLSQLSDFRNTSSNVLDLVFVKNSNEFRLSKDNFTIIEQNQQDPSHVPYEIMVDYYANSSVKTEDVTVYQYARGHYDRMECQLNAINFQHEFNIRDVDAAYEFFVQTIKSLIEQNVPKKTVRKYSNKPKWWSPELQRLKNRRDKLFKRKARNESTTLEYEEAHKLFSEESDRRYNEYIRQTQENIKSNPAEFWKFAKMNGGIEKYPDRLKFGDKIGNTTEEVVDLFADYFESIYVPDEENWDFDDIYVPISSAEEINVSLFDIEAAIHTLEWKSGAGPDEIKPSVLKMCASSVAWPIWLLYQKSFNIGEIAATSKISRIVPVYKRKGDKADVKNYRVVAIQTIVLKIHDIAVKKKISEIIQPQLKSAQHGFRNKRTIMSTRLVLR
ncbi:uncharacterized protein LOC119077268 [Bradysia coprophila]|uniref:uncharacterized protein LOC119077268 n=1 Tax=Bradysia coprophila TaxID=38358 RepID=UPI00187D9076|nr:uncharacterized protein LOC119077268 [Bradysia coprophila]